MPTNSIVTHNLALAIFQWAFVCLHINHADRTVTYGRPYGGRSTPTPTYFDALEEPPYFFIVFLGYCHALHYASHVPLLASHSSGPTR